MHFGCFVVTSHAPSDTPFTTCIEMMIMRSTSSTEMITRDNELFCLLITATNATTEEELIEYTISEAKRNHVGWHAAFFVVIMMAKITIDEMVN